MSKRAFFDLLAQLQGLEVSERIRIATERFGQELIDAGLAALIGPASLKRTGQGA